MKAPEICNFSKKRLQYKCLPENSAKFLRITFLQNTFEWLLLDIFIHLTTKLIFAILWTNRNQVFYIFERFIMTFAFWRIYFAKQTTHRNSCLHMFSKIGVLKSFTNFTGKHLYWSRFLIKFQALHGRCFPVKFVKLSKTPFLTEHLLWLLLDPVVAA